MGLFHRFAVSRVLGAKELRYCLELRGKELVYGVWCIGEGLLAIGYWLLAMGERREAKGERRKAEKCSKAADLTYKL